VRQLHIHTNRPRNTYTQRPTLCLEKVSWYRWRKVSGQFGRDGQRLIENHYIFGKLLGQVWGWNDG
jgi:hypothetical protein